MTLSEKENQISDINSLTLKWTYKPITNDELNCKTGTQNNTTQSLRKLMYRFKSEEITEK